MVWRTAVSAAWLLTDQLSTPDLWHHLLLYGFFLLLEIGRRFLELLPVVFLVTLFLLSWTMAMAHPEHLRGQPGDKEEAQIFSIFCPGKGWAVRRVWWGVWRSLFCLWGRRYSNKSSFPSCSVCAAPRGPSRARGVVGAAATSSTGTVQAGDEPWVSQGWVLGHGGGHGVENVQNPDRSPSTGWQDRAGQVPPWR